MGLGFMNSSNELKHEAPKGMRKQDILAETNDSFEYEEGDVTGYAYQPNNLVKLFLIETFNIFLNVFFLIETYD